jgi:hypothetical protein
MVFPLQAEGYWITVGWAVEAAVLVAFGLRVESYGLKGMGTFLLMLALGRLFLLDTPAYLMERHVEVLPPFLHPYGLAFLTVTACVWGIVLVGRRLGARLDLGDRAGIIVCAVGGVFLVWFILTLESYRYTDEVFGSRSAQTVLSVVWASYAIVLLASGFRLGSAALRWAALALFGLTLVKVFIVDMSQLPGFYRVAAFFGLAVMMGVAAWGYQRFQLGRLMTGAEVRDEQRT